MALSCVWMTVGYDDEGSLQLCIKLCVEWGDEGEFLCFTILLLLQTSLAKSYISQSGAWAGVLVSCGPSLFSEIWKMGQGDFR